MLQLAPPPNVSVRMMPSDSDFYISPQLADYPSSPPPPPPPRRFPYAGVGLTHAHQSLRWPVATSVTASLHHPQRPICFHFPAPRCQKRPLTFDTSQSREWKAHSASVQNMEGNTLLRLQSFKAKSVELQVILLFCQHATAHQQSTEPLTACDVSGVVFLTRESEFLVSAKFFTDKSLPPLPG